MLLLIRLPMAPSIGRLPILHLLRHCRDSTPMLFGFCTLAFFISGQWSVTNRCWIVLSRASSRLLHRSLSPRKSPSQTRPLKRDTSRTRHPTLQHPTLQHQTTITTKLIVNTQSRNMPKTLWMQTQITLIQLSMKVFKLVHTTCGHTLMIMKLLR